MSEPNSNNPMTTKRTDSQATRDECIVLLSSGTHFEDLNERCKELLGAVSKTGILARRNSSVGRTWGPSEGHSARTSHSDPMFGEGYDHPTDNKSVGEIFIQNKSPEAREKIRSTIARTASRGGRVRSQELVSEQDINREKAKDLIRRSSREEERKNL